MSTAQQRTERAGILEKDQCPNGPSCLDNVFVSLSSQLDAPPKNLRRVLKKHCFSLTALSSTTP